MRHPKKQTARDRRPARGQIKVKRRGLEGAGNGSTQLLKELWQAAVTLRGSIEPGDYKRYVLPIIFLRFLTLRYERRRGELQRLVREKESEYYTSDSKTANAVISDPDEYRAAGAFIVPERAAWDYIVKNAWSDKIEAAPLVPGTLSSGPLRAARSSDPTAKFLVTSGNPEEMGGNYMVLKNGSQCLKIVIARDLNVLSRGKTTIIYTLENECK